MGFHQHTHLLRWSAPGGWRDWKALRACVTLSGSIEMSELSEGWKRKLFKKCKMINYIFKKTPGSTPSHFLDLGVPAQTSSCSSSPESLKFMLFPLQAWHFLLIKLVTDRRFSKLEYIDLRPQILCFWGHKMIIWGLWANMKCPATIQSTISTIFQPRPPGADHTTHWVTSRGPPGAPAPRV